HLLHFLGELFFPEKDFGKKGLLFGAFLGFIASILLLITFRQPLSTEIEWVKLGPLTLFIGILLDSISLSFLFFLHLAYLVLAIYLPSQEEESPLPLILPLLAFLSSLMVLSNQYFCYYLAIELIFLSIFLMLQSQKDLLPNQTYTLPSLIWKESLGFGSLMLWLSMGTLLNYAGSFRFSRLFNILGTNQWNSSLLTPANLQGNLFFSLFLFGAIFLKSGFFPFHRHLKEERFLESPLFYPFLLMAVFPLVTYSLLRFHPLIAGYLYFSGNYFYHYSTLLGLLAWLTCLFTLIYSLYLLTIKKTRSFLLYSFYFYLSLVLFSFGISALQSAIFLIFLLPPLFLLLICGYPKKERLESLPFTRTHFFWVLGLLTSLFIPLYSALYGKKGFLMEAYRDSIIHHSFPYYFVITLAALTIFFLSISRIFWKTYLNPELPLEEGIKTLRIMPFLLALCLLGGILLFGLFSLDQTVLKGAYDRVLLASSQSFTFME
ncbi:MAG: hypothetical protein D6785_16660, partial [Planctomycetota bacterium]